MVPGDAIVLVAAAARPRRDAAAADFAMDHLATKLVLEAREDRRRLALDRTARAGPRRSRAW
jgi:molybdopterin synthase catalytic subunit